MIQYNNLYHDWNQNNQIDHKNYLRSFYLLSTFELHHRFIYREETISIRKDSDLQHRSIQRFIFEMETTVKLKESFWSMWQKYQQLDGTDHQNENTSEMNIWVLSTRVL